MMVICAHALLVSKDKIWSSHISKIENLFEKVRKFENLQVGKTFGCKHWPKAWWVVDQLFPKIKG